MSSLTKLQRPTSPIHEWLEETFPNDQIVLADGFDDALLGVGGVFTDPPVAVYDSTRCIRILMEKENLTESDAIEYFEFYVKGAYIGERTPIFIYTLPGTPNVH